MKPETFTINRRTIEKLTDRSKSGFTLVELLIVVVVLGILVAFAAREFSETIDDAKVTTLRKNLSTLRSQLQAFAGDKGFYPDTLSDLTQGKNPYLPEIPIDPLTNTRNWQIAPPPVNSIDLAFYDQAGIPPPHSISKTAGPDFDPLGQTADRIIDSGNPDPLTFSVPGTVGKGDMAFSGNLPKLEIDLKQPRDVQTVKIHFYSVHKFRYQVKLLQVGSENISDAWAINDVFTFNIKKRIAASKITLTFDVQKNSTVSENVPVGIASMEMIEKIGSLVEVATDPKPLITGYKWYHSTAWDSSQDRTPGHARSLGIGNVRSNKQGFSTY